jgi:hypothetical protein
MTAIREAAQRHKRVHETTGNERIISRKHLCLGRKKHLAYERAADRMTLNYRHKVPVGFSIILTRLIISSRRVLAPS